MGLQGFALMVGNLGGRVARCYNAPPGLKRGGRTIKKICVPRQYSKTVGKGAARVSLAYVKQVGKNPAHLVAYQPANLKPEAASRMVGRLQATNKPTRGPLPSGPSEYRVTKVTKLRKVKKGKKAARALPAGKKRGKRKGKKKGTRRAKRIR